MPVRESDSQMRFSPVRFGSTAGRRRAATALARVGPGIVERGLDAIEVAGSTPCLWDVLAAIRRQSASPAGMEGDTDDPGDPGPDLDIGSDI